MKHNYIDFLNEFWKARRSNRLTNMQADIYYFLLNESSVRGTGNLWVNPFPCTNGLICSAIGITEKSLIKARIVLKENGFIYFENGITKQKSPVYYLPEYWNKVSNMVSKSYSNPGSNTVSIKGNIKKKQNRNKTETLSSSFNKEEADIKIDSLNSEKKEERKKPSAPKKKEVVTEFWPAFVKCWFDYYKNKFVIEPTFRGKEAKALKDIIEKLKRISNQYIANNVELNLTWSEEYGLRVLTQFFERAFADKWLSDNFLLHILSSHFDSIIQKNENETLGTGKTKKSAGSASATFTALNAVLNQSGN